MATTIFLDTFTDVANTSLTSHVPDIATPPATPWTYRNGLTNLKIWTGGEYIVHNVSGVSGHSDEFISSGHGIAGELTILADVYLANGESTSTNVSFSVEGAAGAQICTLDAGRHVGGIPFVQASFYGVGGSPVGNVSVDISAGSVVSARVTLVGLLASLYIAEVFQSSVTLTASTLPTAVSFVAGISNVTTGANRLYRAEVQATSQAASFWTNFVGTFEVP